jgi:hypothetical protein
MEGMIRPDELRKITEDKEMAELRQALDRQKKLEAEQKDDCQHDPEHGIEPRGAGRGQPWDAAE